MTHTHVVLKGSQKERHIFLRSPPPSCFHRRRGAHTDTNLLWASPWRLCVSMYQIAVDSFVSNHKPMIFLLFGSYSPRVCLPFLGWTPFPPCFRARPLEFTPSREFRVERRGVVLAAFCLQDPLEENGSLVRFHVREGQPSFAEWKWKRRRGGVCQEESRLLISCLEGA